jgi:hypothetical protein
VAQGGKRKAAKRAATRAVRLDPSLVLPAAGVTFCVIAWGYLVSAAIDFGSQARSGESVAWVYLAVACLGAVCCLFAGLMMGAHVLRSLGLVRDPGATPEASASEPAPAARIPGGRRARH